MPFAYNDDEQAFVETVTDTLRRHAPIEAVRAVGDAPERWTELWEPLVALDLLAVLVPEELGGLGLSAVALTAILEAAGRFAAPVPLTATAGVFAPLVLAAGRDDPAAAEVVEQMLGGASATAAIPGGRVPLAQLPRLSDGRLTAVCDGIADASRAQLLAVPALRAPEGRLVLVVGPPEQLGLEVRPAMDPLSPIGRLAVHEYPVDEALIFTGDFGSAWATVWTACAAELVGLATELVAMSVRHAQERVQFGQPIGAFQAVKHRLVEAHLAVERARSHTMYAAALIADGPGAATSRAAHRAKAAASQAASAAARTAVQVHGGLGITREHDVSLLYLRARQLSAIAGGADAHLALAARLSDRR